MSGRALNGKEISDLPPEILNYEIKETPRSMLKDIANRSHAHILASVSFKEKQNKQKNVQPIID